MSEEKKQIDEVFNKQKKIASINILNKTYEELGNIFGSPSLIRNDGKTTTVRFDSNKCRLFIFMNLSAETPYAEHYELRNGKGQLIDRDKDIESCFNEIKSA